MIPERLAEIKQVHAGTAPYQPTVTAHGHRGELIKEVERLQEILRRTEIMLKDLAEKHLPAIRAHLGVAGMGYTLKDEAPTEHIRCGDGTVNPFAS